MKNQISKIKEELSITEGEIDINKVFDLLDKCMDIPSENALWSKVSMFKNMLGTVANHHIDLKELELKTIQKYVYTDEEKKEKDEIDKNLRYANRDMELAKKLKSQAGLDNANKEITKWNDKEKKFSEKILEKNHDVIMDQYDLLVKDIIKQTFFDDKNFMDWLNEEFPEQKYIDEILNFSPKKEEKATQITQEDLLDSKGQRVMTKIINSEGQVVGHEFAPEQSELLKKIKDKENMN